MRAYKTVNDSYIEPISFTVPRRAETFQSDIYPPAVGTKPAVSAQEWISGKTGLPAKIDLESIYEGHAPVEVAADYKPKPTPTVSAPAPAPAPAAAPAKEPEAKPTPVPVRSGPPPSLSDQKQTMASIANKYQDEEEENADDDAETSSFEEVSRPQPRGAPRAAPSPYKPPHAAPVKTPTSPIASRAAVFSSTESTSAPAPAAAAAPAAAPALPGSVTDALGKLTQLVEAQNSKIDGLTAEVDSLKKRLLVTSDQSERIRQLELELEEARS